MKSLLELRDEVGSWAEKNFGKNRAPHLGMIEEVGEFCHAELKHFQGIRGLENEETYKKDVADALADAGIFALDFCALHNITPPNLLYVIDSPLRFLLKSLAIFAHPEQKEVYEEMYSSNIYILFNALYTIADSKELHFMTLINETWEKAVSKRDWTKNPHNGENPDDLEDKTFTPDQIKAYAELKRQQSEQ